MVSKGNHPLEKYLSSYSNKTKFLISLLVGLILIILSVALLVPFKDKLLSSIYPKSKSQAAQPKTSPTTLRKRPEIQFASDKILIKLKPGYSLASKGQSKGMITVQRENGVSTQNAISLQNQLNNLGIKGAKKTISSAKKPTEALNLYRKKFPKRSNSISTLAASSLPDLTNIYTLTIDSQKLGVSSQSISRDGRKNVVDKNSKDYFKYGQLLRRLKSNPAVEDAQLDYIYQTTTYPNDPYFSSSNSWGQGYDDQWDMKKIKADLAWAETANGSTTIVAVSDTGVDYNHEDLKDNIWSDENGKHGYDFIYNDDDPMDDNYHGTHVAGTIAASINNSKGIAGTASNAKIMAVKALDRGGYGTIDGLADSIIWAVDHGAQVINMSWGGWGDSPTIRDAVEYAYTMGVVLVAAAGNDDYDARYQFPASYPMVITVGASDEDDQRVSFSNWGQKIDIMAPGGGNKQEQCPYERCSNILSTLSSGTNWFYLLANFQVTAHGENYLRLAGTSMAAPHVSGAAAQVFSKNPNLTPNQVKSILINSADDIGIPGKDPDTGYGRLNVYRAITEMNTQNPLFPRADIANPRLGRVIRGLIDIYGAASQPLGRTVFTLSYAISSNGPWQTQGITLAADGRKSIVGGKLGQWDTTQVADGEYYLRLQVGDTKKTTDLKRVIVNGHLSRSWPAKLYQQGSNWWPPLTADLDGNGTDSLVMSFGDELRVLDSTGRENTPWPISLGDESTYDPFDDLYFPFYPVAGKILGGNGQQIFARSKGSTIDYQNVLRKGLYVFKSDGTIAPGWPVTKAGRILLDTNTIYPPTLTDIDEDGKDEIIIGNYDKEFDSDRLTIFKGDGKLFNNFTIVLPGYLSIAFPPFVIKNQGEAKIIVGVWTTDGDYKIIHYNIQGQATYTSSGSYSSPSEAFLVDINGDAIPEIVWGGQETFEGYDNNGIPTSSKIQAWAIDLQNNLLPGWPKTLASGIHYREDCSVRPCTTMDDYDSVRTLPGDIDGDNQVDIIQFGTRFWRENTADEYHEDPAIYAIKKDGTSIPVTLSSPARSPIWQTHPVILDTNGDGKQEVVYSAYDAADSAYYLEAVQSNGTAGQRVLDQRVTARCQVDDFIGPGLPPTLAQLQNSSNPTVIVPVCGNLSEDYIERRLDLYLVPVTGSATKHDWPQFLHDSKHTTQYPITTPSLSQPISLAGGWNLVGITVGKSNYKAGDLINDLNIGGNTVTQILKYNNDKRGWDSLSISGNILAGTNFDVTFGQGYFIKSSANAAKTISGISPSLISLSLSPGWNLISLPNVPSSINKADTLVAELTRQGLTTSSIVRWVNGAWQTHIANFPVNKFDILPGQGYFVNLTVGGDFTIPSSVQSTSISAQGKPTGGKASVQTRPTQVSSLPCTPYTTDIDKNYKVENNDLGRFVACNNRKITDKDKKGNLCKASDTNGDSKIDKSDYDCIRANIGKSYKLIKATKNAGAIPFLPR